MAEEKDNAVIQEEKEEENEEEKVEEKDKESAEGARPASTKSKSASKSGSGKSTARSGSGKDGKKSAAGQNSAKKGGKGKKTKKKEEEKQETPLPPEEGALPEGVIPVFLASKTQEIFEVRCDEDVTAENPHKLLKKDDILQDLYNRAAVCDFSPLKQQIQDYPGDEILIVYDPEFKYGQNFLIALTEEGKHRVLHPEGEEGGEGGEPEEDVVYQYIPPVAKEWIHLGSDREIQEESLKENRPRLKISVKRLRKHFGAPVQFGDRNVADAKDCLVECITMEETSSFDLKRVELNKGIQAIPVFNESSAQTDWKYPRNAAVQYEPRLFDEETRQKLDSAPELVESTERTVPRFKLALQQNEIMDVFYDDWTVLGDDHSSFGSKADNHLKEYQSFTDLKFSKDKTITGIDWHPTIRGIVAVSVGEKYSFDDRLDNAHRVIMTPSLILIWSFADPIHPQLLLEAPDDILSFKFNPTDPNVIAGGCVNGQVVLWDISQHAERLKAPRGGSKKKNNLSTLPGFEDENSLDTPVVRYCAVSSIEHSHHAPITDILWVPDHFELNRMGVPIENRSGQCSQIMTCATDHCVFVWDTRSPKTASQHHHEKNKEDMTNPMGVPNTFKHLDLSWKPHLKVTLSKSEPGGEHSPIKFSLQEKQGDRSILSKNPDDKPAEKKASETMAGGFSFGAAKPSSATKRTLSHMNTHFYIGTEDGEIVYVDWMPQKDQDSGKIQTPKPAYYHTLHDGQIVTLQRSPFFSDIILCVGGWSFSIWKEGVITGPVLHSCPSNKRLTGAHWSSSRPAVFYVARQDGSVDVWDLLDRTHEPSMNQSVSSAPITAIFPYEVTPKQHLLGVGDQTGTLHILEIPWSLRQPIANEVNGMANYFEREVKRQAFVMERWDFREKEKMELENEKKLKAGIAPNVILTDEELNYRQKLEYQAYIDEEASFLRELGLKEEVEEPLPDVE